MPISAGILNVYKHQLADYATQDWWSSEPTQSLLSDPETDINLPSTTSDDNSTHDSSPSSCSSSSDSDSDDSDDQDTIPTASIHTLASRPRLRTLRLYLSLPITTTPRQLFALYAGRKKPILAHSILRNYRSLNLGDHLPLIYSESDTISKSDKEIAAAVNSLDWPEYSDSSKARADGRRARADRKRKEVIRQEVRDAEDEMELDGFVRRTVLRSYKTELKSPWMQGKDVKKQWTCWKGNKKILYGKEMVAYEESPLSICTIVEYQDDAATVLDGEDKLSV